MRVKSVSVQLTLWYSGVLMVILLILSGFTYFKLSKDLLNSVDEILKHESHEVTTSAVMKNGLVRVYKEKYDDNDLPSAAEFFQIISPEGTIVCKSESVNDFVIPVDKSQFQSLLADKPIVYSSSIRDIPVRVMLMSFKIETQSGYVLQMAISLEGVENASRDLLWNLLVFIPIGIILAAFGGTLLARRFLKPIDKIIEDANSIEAEGLGFRLDKKKVKDEIGRLIDTLNQLFERLQNSFRLIRQFTADASHELSTPLTIMRGEAEVALKSQRTPEEYRQVIETTIEEIERMSNIVDDLLTLSSIDSGEVRLSLSDVYLDEIITNVYDQGNVLAQDKNITIELDGVQHHLVRGDNHRLHQVFLNLIDNAIKYTSPGGKLRLTMIPDNDGVSITVADTGIGIGIDHLDKIFDRFYRVDKARSRELGGSGLGLSIVRSIVELHNGKVGVQSKLGEGSKFTVWLPKRNR